MSRLSDRSDRSFLWPRLVVSFQAGFGDNSSSQRAHHLHIHCVPCSFCIAQICLDRVIKATKFAFPIDTSEDSVKVMQPCNYSQFRESHRTRYQIRETAISSISWYQYVPIMWGLAEECAIVYSSDVSMFKSITLGSWGHGIEVQNRQTDYREANKGLLDRVLVGFVPLPQGKCHAYDLKKSKHSRTK